LLNNVRLKGRKLLLFWLCWGGLGEKGEVKSLFRVITGRKTRFFRALSVVGVGGKMQIRCGTVTLFCIEGLPEERKRSVKLKNKLRPKGYLCSG